MLKPIEEIINDEPNYAHAPSWGKLDNTQWITKLENIIKQPDKYRDSELKRTLLKESNKYNAKFVRYPFIHTNLFGALVPPEYINVFGSTGIRDPGADFDRETDF